MFFLVLYAIFIVWFSFKHGSIWLIFTFFFPYYAQIGTNNLLIKFISYY
jgi:hypothetical protein